METRASLVLEQLCGTLWQSISQSLPPISVNVTLRIPLIRGDYTTIVSGFAPTVCSDEEDKDLFYESLNECQGLRS